MSKGLCRVLRNQHAPTSLGWSVVADPFQTIKISSHCGEMSHLAYFIAATAGTTNPNRNSEGGAVGNSAMGDVKMWPSEREV